MYFPTSWSTVLMVVRRWLGSWGSPDGLPAMLASQAGLPKFSWLWALLPSSCGRPQSPFKRNSSAEALENVHTHTHTHTLAHICTHTRTFQGDGGLGHSSCISAAPLEFRFSFYPLSHSLVNLGNILHRGSCSHFPNLLQLDL